jgi:serine/threonine protein kinase
MQLKPTMREATDHNGTAVILKMAHFGSDEPTLLQYLSKIKSPHNHTIPLLRTFDLDVGKFITVPQYMPLDLGLGLGKFDGKAADFTKQLIEGVGFLHRHDVAHLDIKPQNIVITPHNWLCIIDFDIAVKVKDADYLISSWCGTPQWMAPEIGDRDGPRRLYSPIRADIWSCGQVVMYLASRSGGEERRLKALAQTLSNPDPQLRPLLHTFISLVPTSGTLKKEANTHGIPSLH